MFSKILSRFIFIFLLLSTLTPLVYRQKLFYSFDSEKGLFFRFIVEIIFGLWLILILKNPSFRPQKTLINVALGVLALVLIIVDICGVDTYLSVFSNFERMSGLILYLSVFAYCLVIASVVNTPKRWLFLGISLSVVAVIVAIKGIIQSYNQDDILANGVRVISTIGNANQLAAYLLSGFFIIGLLITQWILPLRENKKFLSNILLVISGIFLIIYAFCLLKTATRGALVGLIAGVSLMLILAFIFTKQKRIKILLATLSIGFVLSLTGLFYFRKAKFITQNTALSRITRITGDGGVNTITSRLENYKVAWEGIKSKPILGWGQETYHYTYAQFFNPKLYNDASWYDRVHNIILEWLIIGGIVGLLAYLSLWGAVLYQIWQKNNRLGISSKVILSGFLMAYFVSNLSLFDNLLTLMAFMITIGFVEQHSLKKEELKPLSLNNKQLIMSGLIVFLFTIFSIQQTCQKAYQSNKSIANAYNAGSLEEVISNYELAYPKALIGRQEIAEQFATMAKDIVNSPMPESDKQRYFIAATNVMKTEVNHHPDYARLQIIYGDLLKAQGDNIEALKTFEKIQTLAPRRQSNLKQLAMFYADNKQYKNAVDLLQSAFLLNTENEELKIYQAIVLAMNGDRSNRDKVVNEISEKELNKNIELIRYSFELTGDLISFLKLCNEHFIDKESTEIISYQTWATTAFSLKDYKQVATAVYCFRRHFAGIKTFRDSRDVILLQQDILNGRNPEFAFEKLN
jgi:O-antigen ligase/tetratricopeptide (TPR) repeat protein